MTKYVAFVRTMYRVRCIRYFTKDRALLRHAKRALQRTARTDCTPTHRQASSLSQREKRHRGVQHTQRAGASTGESGAYLFGN